MQEYTGFAQVYDVFMDNVPYDEWTKLLSKLFKKHAGKDFFMKKEKPLVCELGCGTGNMTRRLRNLGCDMIGIDLSDQMLQIAREKENDDDDSILYLMQDMREFELYGTVNAAVSLCDSLNYLLEEEELLQVFKLVFNYLEPDGLFIFDFHTPYYYRNILGDGTICENRDEGSFIWENYYDNESGINQFDMTIYYSSGKSDCYKRCEETHFQRGYSVATMKKLLKKAGLEFVEALDSGTHGLPERSSERIHIVARAVKDSSSPNFAPDI